MKFKLFAVTGVMALGAGSALAAPMAHADTNQLDQATTTTKATKSVDVQEYWSADRMKNAKDGSELVSQDQKQSAKQSTQSKGQRVAHQGKKAATPSADPESPKKSVGKVFFTLGGSDYVCSGNSVSATNDSVVTTAGHCVNEGPGDFATNFVFVPAYEDGDAPYGKWEATNLATSSAWKNSGDINNDVGFAVMGANSSGQNLAEVVGSTGIEFNAERGQSYTSYGYPAASPFDGESLYSCSGTAGPDTIQSGHTTQGIDCDMTGGSSGGPWLLDNGNQNSINSYGYNGVDKMFGPYYGDVAKQVYDAAAKASNA